MPEAPDGTKRNLIQGTSDAWSPFITINTNNDWLYDLATVNYGDKTGIYAGTTINIFVYLSADEIVLDSSINPRFYIQGAIIDKNGAETWTDWPKYHPFYDKWSTNLVSGNNYKIVKLSAKVSNESYSSINGFKISIRIDGAQSGKFHHKALMVTMGDVFPASWLPAPEDLGWSTATLVPTQSQRYLWKFEYIYYSDGSVEVTSPINISIAGADGTNGQTSHVHFAFADNATGGGFSLTTPKAYMGWYADFNETASNDPTKYKWGKWKGDQGLPGKPGADGNTSYLHLAFASSADGKTGFSFTESGQQYQGYYTDFTQTSSTDYRKYKWVDRFANVQIGGRNLLTGTRDWSSNIRRWANNGVWNNEAEDYNNLKVKSTTGGYNGWHQNVFVKAGEYYTLSYYAKADTNIKVKNSLTWEQSPIFKGPVANFDGSNNISDNITTEWKRYSRTVKITGDGSLQWRIEYDGMALPSGKWYIAGMKLERGTVATDWSPAPEDTQAQIDSKADSALTQEQLNALEAKRLQMEREMKALATMMQVSELEKFINNLKQEDADGRQKIIETTKNIEQGVKDIEPIMKYSKKLKFMDTYITQGNGGMVIGANESTTKVVVTPDRISFQSGGSEVAYISQSMLHIDNGVFTMSLQLGHYITRAHPKNKYVNATYFVK